MDFTDTKLYDVYSDLKNFFQFRKDIKEEQSYKDSKYNKYNLQTNKFGNVVYCQHDFTDTEFMGADFVVQKMIVNYANKLTGYLVDDLRWGEYLDLEISNFVEEETGEPTMSYAFVFTFRFNRFSAKWLVKAIGLIVGIPVGVWLLIYIITKLVAL